MRVQVPGLRDERLLVGIAVGQQCAVGGDDQGVSMRANADFVDHPPHLLEAEFANQPSRRLIETRQMNGKRRRRQQILVDTNRRHGDAVDRQVAAATGW